MSAKSWTDAVHELRRSVDSLALELPPSVQADVSTITEAAITAGTAAIEQAEARGREDERKKWLDNERWTTAHQLAHAEGRNAALDAAAKLATGHCEHGQSIAYMIRALMRGGRE